MNDPQLIFLPMMAMIGIIFLVWLTMFIRHSIYLGANGIDAQKIAMPEQVNAIFPAEVRLAGNNLRNLFELPVIFFVLCLALFELQRVDRLYLRLAWIYVGLRAVHSVIHCTTNRVNLRFSAWFLSNIALWFIAGRLAQQLLQ